jgi:hypothetical protein
MHHATPQVHVQLARQRQQALLDDARSYRQGERAPRRASLRLAIVTLIACAGVGAIGLSQAKAATATSTTTAARLAEHTASRPNVRSRHLAANRALMAVAALASPANPSACQPYKATGRDAAETAAGPYVGTQDVTIGGTTYAGVSAVTTVLAPLTPQGNSGVLTTTTSHAIALPTGPITTTDQATLIPTRTAGVYTLFSHLVITGGATGEVLLAGTVDFNTLTAEGTFIGVICGQR